MHNPYQAENRRNDAIASIEKVTRSQSQNSMQANYILLLSASSFHLETKINYPHIFDALPSFPPGLAWTYFKSAKPNLAENLAPGL